MAQAIQQAGWQAIVASAGRAMVARLTQAKRHPYPAAAANQKPAEMRANAAVLARIIKEHKVDITMPAARPQPGAPIGPKIGARLSPLSWHLWDAE